MITNLLSISGIAYHDRSRVALGGVATCGDTQLHIEGGRTRVIFTINSRHGPQLATVVCQQLEASSQSSCTVLVVAGCAHVLH